MKSNSTAFLIKIKLRYSLGRPSRSDFVQLAVVTNAELEYNITIFGKGFLNIPEKE